jgi:hypothetical protein
VARHAAPPALAPPVVRNAARLLRSGCPAREVAGILRQAVDAGEDACGPAPADAGAGAAR